MTTFIAVEAQKQKMHRKQTEYQIYIQNKC